MGGNVLEVLIESSADIPGGPADPLMIFAKTTPVPRNSGVQNVYPKIIKALNRARLLRPPYRQIAIQKAKESLYGIASISSENAGFLKELNTERQHTTLSGMGTNVGQPKSSWDNYLYGKDYLKNNPSGGDEKFF